MLSVSFIPGDLIAPATNAPDIRLGEVANGLRPVEPTVTVNRVDPGNIAVSSHNGLRLSTNAGGTFADRVTFPNLAGASSRGDTDTAFDAQGRLFWTNLQSSGILDVAVARIDPLTGAPIGDTSNVTAQGTDPFFSFEDDKQFIVADDNPNSPFADRLYIVWTKFRGGCGPGGIQGTQVLFSRSENQGVTVPITSVQQRTMKGSFGLRTSRLDLMVMSSSHIMHSLEILPQHPEPRAEHTWFAPTTVA